jgi:hypothetical protein
VCAHRFRARWREELEAISPLGKLVFEFTMGRPHVYFPSAERWRALAPAWAAEAWSVYREACERWCAENRSGFSLVDDSNYHEEERERSS